jgi:hypothetical protein
MSGLKRFILWDYPRAGWQYDIMVGVILAFIFLTPRGWFRDQPKASNIVMIPAQHGSAFFIEPELLDGVPESGWQSRAAAMVRERAGSKYTVTEVKPIFDSEQEIRGYMAFTTP